MEEDQNNDSVLAQINQRLEYIEKKINMLIAQGASVPRMAPPRERESFSRERSDSYSEKRELTRVQCAKCGNTCEVPFRPTGDRPVYCSDCFGRQKDRPPREGFNKRGPSKFRPKKDRY